MNILSSSKGSFIFIDEDDNTIEYDDYRSIPEELNFKHVVKFLPIIPPGPHTIEQHDEINQWNDRFKKVLNKIYGI